MDLGRDLIAGFFQGWLLLVLLTSVALRDPVPIDTVVQHWLLATNRDCIAVGLSLVSIHAVKIVQNIVKWIPCVVMYFVVVDIAHLLCAFPANSFGHGNFLQVVQRNGQRLGCSSVVIKLCLFCCYPNTVLMLIGGKYYEATFTGTLVGCVR